jgi:glutamyl-tRNA(Gln) amidotransferase subunit E
MTDYQKIGLKVGVEIHQQLDTRKLFCECSSDDGEKAKEGPKATNSPSSDNHNLEMRRRLRAVAGETGDIDRAALHEVLRGKEFRYMIYPHSTCLVEMDCEPPHPMNMEALDVGLTMSAMLDCEIPDEIHVMRKQVVDGSNTTGFQRTAIVGLKGTLNTQKGKVGITNVSVEEEASQILGTDEKSVTYGLDRLSIPLVEIGTSPDIRHPEQAKEVCQALGMLLRSTGKVKRGIGTIRQDINISIRGGARIEIKGAQELRLIPKYVENEVERQSSLLQIREEMKGFRPVSHHASDVTEIFGKSKSGITRDKKTFGIKIPGFSGMFRKKLTPTRTLGNEIANYAKVKSGARGIIHSDEDLGKYQLEEEFMLLRKSLGALEADLLMIVSGEEAMCRNAIKAAAERANMLLTGVPEETRKALESGDSEYMRPLPGSARMYPETDIPPIPLDGKKLQEVRKNLPELIEHKITRLMKQHGLHEEMAKQVVQSVMGDAFEKSVKEILDPVLVATTLTSTLTYLRREGVQVDSLQERHFLELFKALHEKKFSKEKIAEILKMQAESPELGIEKILEKSGAKALTLDELRHIVSDAISRNQQALSSQNPEQVVMGLVMEKVRGRISGKIVMEVVKEAVSQTQK